MTPYSYGSTLLSIEHINLTYGDKIVLRDVNAAIKDIIVPGKVTGQIVGFLGPSGIGKSTLCRVMAGLLSPDSGRVVLDSLDRPVRAGEVGVVAQNYPLFEHRTVQSNLILSARRKGDDKDAQERVQAYLHEFDLAPLAHQYPSQLSGGQRQRCAILQQILVGSQLVIMDEPFSGLDPLMKIRAQELIVKVANLAEKNTIVIVSHDIAAAASVSDHLWLMGLEYGADGNRIPGARIVETYDLIERDLAWTPGIQKTDAFLHLVSEINERFKNL